VRITWSPTRTHCAVGPTTVVAASTTSAAAGPFGGGVGEGGEVLQLVPLEGTSSESTDPIGVSQGGPVTIPPLAGASARRRAAAPRGTISYFRFDIPAVYTADQTSGDTHAATPANKLFWRSAGFLTLVGASSPLVGAVEFVLRGMAAGGGNGRCF
jgi:hypothetical protein